jgi:hypothetical protein
LVVVHFAFVFVDGLQCVFDDVVVFFVCDFREYLVVLVVFVVVTCGVVVVMWRSLGRRVEKGRGNNRDSGVGK